MSVHFGPYTFDHASYDGEGDVLYLAIGEPREAADSEETAEGHIVRYDAQEQVIGLTLVNAKWLLERDDNLSVSFPGRSATADTRELRAAIAR
jgi:uncharacterized protein YuzE